MHGLLTQAGREEKVFGFYYGTLVNKTMLNAHIAQKVYKKGAMAATRDWSDALAILFTK